MAHLKLYGIPPHNNVSVQQENMEIIVFNVQLLDIGIPSKIIVYAQLPEQYGMQQILAVFAQ